MNKIKNYFRKNTFTLCDINKDGRYGIVAKGYCIAGVIISFKQLNLIKNGKLYNLPIVLNYYYFIIRRYKYNTFILICKIF